MQLVLPPPGSNTSTLPLSAKTAYRRGPPSPLLSTVATYTPDPSKALFKNSGDWLLVDIRDTSHGLAISIQDLTTGHTGSMKASAANGFGQVQFDPSGTNCNPSTHDIPCDFHAMYSTSSEHTRVPWSAHSYNIAFSDEIGHFEYCNAVDNNGNCTTPGVNDPGGVDRDDVGCFPASASSRNKIGGCVGADVDFDGESSSWYGPGPWRAPDRTKVPSERGLVLEPAVHTNKGIRRGG
jgi:hypothetical protein